MMVVCQQRTLHEHADQDGRKRLMKHEGELCAGKQVEVAVGSFAKQKYVARRRSVSSTLTFRVRSCG